MIKIANNLEKFALIKQAAKPDVKDMLDMNSLGGLYADVTPLDFLGTAHNAKMQRAGRATAMAEALGMKPGYTTKYPITSMFTSGMAGLLLGGGIGGGIGYGVSGNEQDGLLGSIIGMSGGALAGALINELIRRKSMKQIAAAYEKAKPSDIDPQLHDPSLLDVWGGFHNTGRQKAIKAMLGDKANPSDYSDLEKLLMPVGGVGVSLLAGPIVGTTVPGIVMNNDARNLAKDNKKKINKKKKNNKFN